VIPPAPPGREKGGNGKKRPPSTLRGAKNSPKEKKDGKEKFQTGRSYRMTGKDPEKRS